jgi:hypothetical protein
LEVSEKLVGDFIPLKIKPKMLFLDDRTKRIMSAIAQYSDRYDVTIVTNTKECLRHLCREEWNILSLDHDLNGDDFQDPDERSSGMEVARYIMKTGWPSKFRKPEVWVHSSNLFAAELMLSVFQSMNFRAYYHKFEYDNEKCFCDNKPAPKIDIYSSPACWITQGYGRCVSCHKEDQVLDKNTQCHACWEREVKQCASS